MKRLPILTIVVLFFSYSSGQETHEGISYKHHSIQAGDSIRYLKVCFEDNTAVDLLLAEWDISNLNKIDGQLVTMSSYETPGYFKGLQNIANVMVRWTSDNLKREMYYTSNSHNLSLVGIGDHNFDYDLIHEFENPCIEMIYPFHLGDLFNDHYSYSINYDDSGEELRMDVDGSVAVRADAMGALSGADKKSYKIIRIKFLINETIYTFMNDQQMNAVESSKQIIRWYAIDKRYFLLELSKENNQKWEGLIDLTMIFNK